MYLGEEYRPHSVSMFHQLSCLDVLRQELFKAHMADNRPPPTGLGKHCLNYLRQMVLCRSDLGLDYAVGKPEVKLFSDTYVCRDWSRAYDGLSTNQEVYRQWMATKVGTVVLSSSNFSSHYFCEVNSTLLMTDSCMRMERDRFDADVGRDPSSRCQFSSVRHRSNPYRPLLKNMPPNTGLLPGLCADHD